MFSSSLVVACGVGTRRRYTIGPLRTASAVVRAAGGSSGEVIGVGRMGREIATEENAKIFFLYDCLKYRSL